MTYPTLEHVAMEARPYPAHLLEGCETGLVLFAAAFLGHNDAVHFAEAGIRTTCVDIDSERLAEMEKLYPEDWRFVQDDAWKFAEEAWLLGDQWDVVSVDPFTGDAMRRVLDSVRLWCALARKAVIVGWQTGLTVQMPSEGWRVDTMERASDIYWLVLGRA